MNGIIESLHSRKSVRSYKDMPISDEVKQELFAAALAAPTAGNMTLYSIIDVTDSELKQRLSVTCDNQPFIATSPLVLVFCADYYRWYKLFCKHEDEVRLPAEGDLMLAQADAIIAAQNVVVAAESMGLGSCYIGDITENFEIHRKLLGLPEYVVPACMLCIGYPTEQQLERPKPVRFKIEDIVSENRYSTCKADQMEQMLAERESLSEVAISEWIKRFCKRKWNCEFSEDMSRSCREKIKDWCKK